MEKDSRQFRQYQSPTSVEAETTLYYKQLRQVNGQHGPVISNIPGLDELLAIKANIEKLLPLAENRLRQFRKDAQFIEKWRKGREVSDKRKERLPDSDMKSGSKKDDTPKSNDRAHVKEESIDQLYQLAKPSNGTHGVNENGNRKRKERDEADRSDMADLPITKAKRADDDSHMDPKLDVPKVDSTVNPVVPRKTTSKGTGTPKSEHRDKDNGIFKSPARANHPQPPRNGHKTNQKPKVEQIEVDLIRVKSKDQIPIQTFWNAMEPYFRTVSESERDMLMEEGDNVKPYLIPPLGRYYLDTWAEEERLLVPSFETSPRHSRSPSVTSARGTFDTNGIQAERTRYLESPESFTEDHFGQYDLSCGSLTERLISCLLRENLLSTEEMNGHADTDADPSTEDDDIDTTESINDKPTVAAAEPTLYPPERIINFEDRLKRELRYSGLLVEDYIDWDSREDDEVCAEMRKLQTDLREQVKINAGRKQKLLKVVEGQLQYEQYKQILDGLDGQVEHSYFKRYQRFQKSKKKTVPVLPKTALSDNALYAMEKRRTWINSIGAIFKDRSLVMPKTSIYEDPEQVKTEQENGVKARRSQS
ncbi:histone acetyltransferases subunit 3-domain-containing protein [Umbelopsis sp. PMI_123]|nr:histone acetyltransferases subunit 3-domain-containing protein [Umbelopsis sp. PMI_123]